MKILSNKFLFCLALFLVIAYGKNRVITMRNLCTEPVWMGFAGGSSRSRASQSTSCGSDADCYEGTKCVQTGPIRQCFFVNPRPDDGNFLLSSNQQKDVNIPISSESFDIIWSGAITGKTGCDSKGANCRTADCGNDGQGGCNPGQGFMQPATQAEMTIAKQFVDFYDIEVINGVHIPVSMDPINVPSSGTYDCGNPGSKYPKTNHGSCSWDLKPPLNDYYWVTAGGNACNVDSDCSNSQCGISFNPGHADLLQKSCGQVLGYWTADQICGINPNYGAPFNCNQRLPAPLDYLTNANLLGCTGGIGSCYQSGASTNCCGCANWDQEGLPVPPQPDTQACKSSNPFWSDRVKAGLVWLKRGCPSAYTYPFDDVSSTFTCKQVVDGVNSVNYMITFCPQNEQKLAEKFLQ